MSFNAHLIGFDLDAILQIVSSTRKSGAVSIISEGMGARLFFREGRVVYASSDSRERLGHRLIQKGLLDEEQLRTALESQAQPNDGRPVASVLCDEGWIDEETLASEVTGHVVDVVRDMLEWSEGSLIFEPVQPSAGSIVLDRGMSVENLLLRAAASGGDGRQEVEDELTKLVGYSSD